jgi:hypothetical protein
LRDHIDVHRIIGLNVAGLRASQINDALVGYMQKTALESLAIHICKVYEASTRNELDSIPGIIESLHVTPLSDTQRPAFAVFGQKYGNHAEPLEAKSYLMETFGLFMKCTPHRLSA